MSGREWKPGDVAAIPFSDGDHRALWVSDEKGWAIEGKFGGHNYGSIRPLVVIDPDSDADIDRLLAALGEDIDWLSMQAALREFANPTPPRPEEPTGLGAVVEDADGRTWIRTSDTDCVNPWQKANAFEDGEWKRIAAVRVLSEGVTP